MTAELPIVQWPETGDLYFFMGEKTGGYFVLADVYTGQIQQTKTINKYILMSPRMKKKEVS